MLAAVRLGADPTDPRLQAAAEKLLEGAFGDGGFASGPGEAADPRLTARALHAFGELGWCRHQRFLEALAWLDEAAPRSSGGGWTRHAGSQGEDCDVTPVAVLSTLAACGLADRRELRGRAVRALSQVVAGARETHFELAYPNLDRTDVAEIFAAMARAGVAWRPELGASLERLQAMQVEGGRWLSQTGEPSRWITLEAAKGVLTYAVDAGLPRMFPAKPK